MKKNKIKGAWLLCFLFFGCDFSPRIHKQVLSAQEFISEQKYDQAVSQYSKILKLDPPNDTKLKVYYQLGDLYSIYLSQNKKSVEYYLKVKELTNDPFWLIKTEERLAEVYFFYLNNYKESAKAYGNLSRFNPALENKDFYEYREAISLFNFNKLDLSRKKFKTISENSKHKYFIDSLYYLGQINFRQQKWAEAIKPTTTDVRKTVHRPNEMYTKRIQALGTMFWYFADRRLLGCSFLLPK